MKDKKDIDKIFQEGFENLDLSPSPQVWENIQAELKKESDRKVIPLWMRLGGVAALIAVLLSVGNWVFDPLNSDQPAITQENVEQIDQEIEGTIDESQKIDETQIVAVSASEKENADRDKTRKTDDTKKAARTIADENTQVAKSSSDKKDTQTSPDREDKNIPIANEGIAKEISKEGRKASVEKEDTHQQQFNRNEKAIANEHTKEVRVEDDVADKIDERPSIMDAIAAQESIASADEKSKTKPENRWSVTPNLAPVYYNSFGSGSSIDPDLDFNPQKGDVNMSYGVNLSYAFNDRLSVRTGLNNVDLSYSTSDIVIATGPVSRGLEGVDYGGKNVVVTAVSRKSLTQGTPNGEFDGLNLKSSAGNARLIQSINYYEVPVELQYALIDKRIGVNLIGGVSTLFLGENEISVRSDNFSDVLGSANNLSNVSFSTNVGVGLNYKLSKRFLFNIEPTFKYQLNPYSDSSVGFKPYYLGVYSGLSFKF